VKQDYDRDLKQYNDIFRNKDELERSLSEIRILGDELKESRAYEKYGYVTKSDLIEVYKSKKHSLDSRPHFHHRLEDKGFKDDESSDDDILLMI